MTWLQLLLNKMARKKIYVKVNLMETVKSVPSLKKFVGSTENGHCQSCHLANRGQKGWRVPEGPTGEDTTSYFLHVNPHGKAQIINSLCAHVSWWGEGAMPEAQLF